MADKEKSSRKVVEGEVHDVDMTQPDTVAMGRVEQVVGFSWQLHPYSLSGIAMFQAPYPISEVQRAMTSRFVSRLLRTA